MPAIHIRNHLGNRLSTEKLHQVTAPQWRVYIRLTEPGIKRYTQQGGQRQLQAFPNPTCQATDTAVFYLGLFFQ